MDRRGTRRVATMTASADTTTRARHARREQIAANFFAMAEIDPAKVESLVQHLLRGGRVPPVVAATYGDKAMPLDGHHRFAAHRILNRPIDAWTISGKMFDRLCTEHRRAEELILCDGIPAMHVAESWSVINGH